MRTPGLMIPDEVIMDKIYLIRGKKVMLDRDLADLYQVETKRLKEQVRRNIDRFPGDFMFELTKEELDEWRDKFGTSSSEIMGLRIPPFAFTEYGVVMLASVLNSERAIHVNIRIVRIFIHMRQILETHFEILRKLEVLEKNDLEQDERIMLIFEYLKKLEAGKQLEFEQKNRKRIGFKTSGNS
jgi:hypothetical protein